MSEDMTFVPTSAPLDLSEWEFSFTDRDSELGKLINAAMRKELATALDDVLTEYPPCLSLPISWAPNGDGFSGSAVEDPATIYLGLPFDKRTDCEHLYAISLERLIESAFWGEHEIEEWETESYEPTENALAFARRLRELADLVERGPDDWGIKKERAK